MKHPPQYPSRRPIRDPGMAAHSVIGVFGGTFDPVHFGHLRLGIDAIDKLGIGEVRIVPAGVPPHRVLPFAPAAARLRMTALAIAGEPRFVLDDAEAMSTEPGYTVDTLTRLRGELGPAQPLCLLLGSDAFAGLATWSRWRQLFELAHIGVATRAGQGSGNSALTAPLAGEYAARYRDSAACLAAAPAGSIVRFSMSALDISASAIRELLGAGRSPRYLLPDTVLDYIASNRLYARESDGR
jgi:nicotinate-nucleotide adenylyltransferase